eukprot:4516244-Pleurochrysis_carterae.AAC.2
MRKECNSDACRHLHARLTESERQHAVYRLRRDARGLAALVRALSRPHLSAASDSHKLLPMLITWTDLTDSHARAAALAAVSASPQARNVCLELKHWFRTGALLLNQGSFEWC